MASPGPRWLTSLRLATVGVLLSSFAVLGVGQFIAARHSYTASLDQSEQHDELLRARHVQALFAATLEELKRQSWDNATWDEAYRYVRGENPGFIDVNFAPGVYDVHNTDMIAVLGADFTLLATRAFDHLHNTTVAPPAGLIQALAAQGDIARFFRPNAPNGGYARFDGQTYLVGTSPVLRNGGVGEPAGWFVSLRRIDASYTQYLGERVGSHATMRIVGADHGDLPTGAVPLSVADLKLDATRDDTMLTRFVLGAIDHAHRLEVQLDTPRTVHAAAVAGARSLLLSTLAAGALASLLALWFIDRRLLSPLHAITQRLRTIGERTRLSDRLPESAREDEIGLLAHTMNGMLARIEAHEEATEFSRDAAVRASRIKSEFVARMSHEIRTPMNGVLGMTELLQRTDLNERQRKFCETIHRSATSLLDIVNDILDFSKMEAGRLLLQPVPFSLRDTVEDVVELLAARAHARGTELIVAVDPGVPLYVTSDPVRLTQILTNLIGNAIKFTDGGEILVRVRQIASRGREMMLECSVRDTGIGISPEACGTIFESFTQADNADCVGVRGTGLGLAIAKQLVELMGGRISVSSSVGRGSTFTFTVAAELPDKVLAPPPASDLLAGRSILIADDNVSASGVLASALHALGAQTQTVHTHEAIIAALSSSAAPSIELVLIDHALREPEVLARLQELRAGAGARGPRIVVLSPVQGASPGLLAEMNSIDAYLTKPVRHTLLVSTVSRLLGVRAGVALPGPMTTGEYTAHRRLLGLKVLVVEDNPVNREVAVGMLNALGCSARTANDGQEALTLLEREDFEVILMDRQMPRLDGLATTSEIRRREANRRKPPTPIIALTAHAMPGSREECLRVGMNDFLLKPFSLSELSRVLGRYARRRATEHAASASTRRAQAEEAPVILSAGAA